MRDRTEKRLHIVSALPEKSALPVVALPVVALPVVALLVERRVMPETWQDPKVPAQPRAREGAQTAPPLSNTQW
jgi:hypothetical protein